MITIPMQGARDFYAVGDKIVLHTEKRAYLIKHINGSSITIEPCLTAEEKIVLFFFCLSCLFFVLHVLWIR